MRVEFSQQAETDLRAIAEYIAENRPKVAVSVVARIEQAIRQLERLPRLGRSGLLPGTRELTIAGLPYKAVYRIEEDLVLILTVVHTRRAWP